MIVDLGGRSIGVVNHDGTLYALRNSCPHHGAPLCRGVVTGRMLPSAVYDYSDEPVLRCPGTATNSTPPTAAPCSIPIPSA